MYTRNLEITGKQAYWVAAEDYGGNPLSPEQNRFVLERTASGLWSVAVRGYHDGEPVELALGKNNHMQQMLNDGSNGAEVFGFADEVHQIASDEVDEYMSRVTEPEDREGLLVQILEQQREGVWDLTAPAEYNDYDSFATLTLVEPGQSVLQWGTFGGDIYTGNYSAGGHTGYNLDNPVLVKLVKNDSALGISPYLSSKSGLQTDSLRQRVMKWPTRTIHMREITDGDRTLATSLRESFEYGLDPIAVRSEPLTASILQHMQ